MNHPTVPMKHKLFYLVFHNDYTNIPATAVVSPPGRQTESVLKSANTLTVDFARSTDLVLVHALRSVFGLKFRFKTRVGNVLVDQHNANTTFAINFWSHFVFGFEVET